MVPDHELGVTRPVPIGEHPCSKEGQKVPGAASCIETGHCCIEIGHAPLAGSAGQLILEDNNAVVERA